MTGPSTVVSNPTDSDDTCPGCGTTTGVHPPALSVIGLLPTPQERSAAFLALLRAEVAQRKEHPVTTVTVCLPAGELFNLDPMASGDTVAWRCRLCGCEGTARYRPAAHSDAVEHLTAEHHATIGTAPD